MIGNVSGSIGELHGFTANCSGILTYNEIGCRNTCRNVYVHSVGMNIVGISKVCENCSKINVGLAVLDNRSAVSVAILIKRDSGSLGIVVAIINANLHSESLIESVISSCSVATEDSLGLSSELVNEKTVAHIGSDLYELVNTGIKLKVIEAKAGTEVLFLSTGSLETEELHTLTAKPLKNYRTVVPKSELLVAAGRAVVYVELEPLVVLKCLLMNNLLRVGLEDRNVYVLIVEHELKGHPLVTQGTDRKLILLGLEAHVITVTKDDNLVVPNAEKLIVGSGSSGITDSTEVNYVIHVTDIIGLDIELKHRTNARCGVRRAKLNEAVSGSADLKSPEVIVVIFQSSFVLDIEGGCHTTVGRIAHTVGYAPSIIISTVVEKLERFIFLLFFCLFLGILYLFVSISEDCEHGDKEGENKNHREQSQKFAFHKQFSFS